jgi:hypothetical protein
MVQVSVRAFGRDGRTQIVAGNASFSKEKLIENIRARADAAQKSRPAGAFGACRCRFPAQVSRADARFRLARDIYINTILGYIYV